MPDITNVADTSRPPVNDLDRAYQALSGKLTEYNDYWRYYDGDQPLTYSSGRLRDIFRDLELARFVENWCAVVIDAAADRIILKSLGTKETAANDALEQNWEDHTLSIESTDVHEAAMVIGEAFLIIWADENEELQVFHNDPRLCHLFYESSNPREKEFGAKWWLESSGHARMTLYYPDRLEYFRTRGPSRPTSWKSFESFNPTKEDGEMGSQVDNPFEEVPFFHFRLERRKVKSDLVNVVPLQNGINKLRADMMVAAEFGAFKQRWIISHGDTESLKNSPNEIWGLPGSADGEQDTEVGQFDATDLDNYIQATDSLASSLATISRTPKHYLFKQGGDPSGEALIAMEAPLNKKCAEHITQFIPVWKDAARFMLKVQGIDVEARDIVADFETPATVLPRTAAEVRKFGRESGIPLITLLRDEGKDPAWLEQMEVDKKEEDAQSPVLDLLGQMRGNDNG